MRNKYLTRCFTTLVLRKKMELKEENISIYIYHIRKKLKENNTKLRIPAMKPDSLGK